MSLFCVRLDPPASRTTSWPPRCVNYTRHPAPIWMRSSETPSPTNSTSPRRPRSSRLIRETTTPRIAASVKWSSQEVNSGSALTLNTEFNVIDRLQVVKPGQPVRRKRKVLSRVSAGASCFAAPNRPAVSTRCWPPRCARPKAKRTLDDVIAAGPLWDGKLVVLCTTTAMRRIARFCWYLSWVPVVGNSSKPWLSAAASNPPFLSVDQPSSYAVDTSCPVSRCRSGAGVPWSKRTRTQTVIKALRAACASTPRACSSVTPTPMCR